MKYSELCTRKVSRLGFGTMRLPVKDGEIDMTELCKMTDYAIENGVNYFDTAYPYHDGMSEICIAKALSKYPRDSYFIADKFPGHQIMEKIDPEGVFETQLKRLNTDYIDFYLLHNVNEHSMSVYMNPEYGIIDYFLEQKRKGRIKHLGFSTHATPEGLKRFLDYAGDSMEFCQIQLNYLDYSLQRAGEKYRILEEHGIPVIIMEPLRGGKLAKVSYEAIKSAFEKEDCDSAVSYAFRYLLGFDGIKVTLSGMSSLADMKENIEIHSNAAPLTEGEVNALYRIASTMNTAVPCTACRYCVGECPVGLDIPTLLGYYNDMSYQANIALAIPLQYLEDGKGPADCIGCGACKRACPQGIDIPAAMKALADIMRKLPSWNVICKNREDAQNRLNGK